MSNTQLMIVVATVWIAPHTTKWFAIIASSVAIILAVLGEVFK